jgi:hypothetical protein
VRGFALEQVFLPDDLRGLAGAFGVSRRPPAGCTRDGRVASDANQRMPRDAGAHDALPVLKEAAQRLKAISPELQPRPLGDVGTRGQPSALDPKRETTVTKTRAGVARIRMRAIWYRPSFGANTFASSST